MVQQIASVKAESAASALPFTLSVSALSVQNGTRQTFNNELLRQSQPSNANDAGRQSDVARNSITQRETASERQIASVQKQNAINEQAKARADEAHARRQDQVAQTASSPRAVSDNKTVDNTATNNTDGVNRSKVTLNFEADNKPTSNEAFDPNKTSGERTSDVPLVPTSDNTLPEVVTSANGNGGINEQNNIQISREGVTEQFDYIDYVTQLAEFTGSNTDDASQSVALSDNELGILSTDANKMPDIALINTLEIAPESNTALTNEMQNELNANDSTMIIGLENSQMVNENTSKSMNISREDLLELIQIQEGPLAQEADTSVIDKVKVAQIVDDLMAQYEAANIDGSVLVEVSEADKELLASLLIHGKSKHTVDKENIDESKVLLVEPALGNKASLAQTDKAASVTNSSAVAPTINTEINGDALAIDKANVDLKQALVTVAIEEPSKPTELKIDINDNKAKANAFSLRNIAQLNEEQSKAALESLSSRVQAVVSDISSESKGNEFVAALQSGLKEFKQQLAQGREPGIDLKTIVAEAIAQISGEAAVSQQPKIDAALSQFSAVLNIANAVNNSATQQAAQVLGMSDTQLAKEFTLGQIEGTKLANGIQNQSNVLSTTDKAINIFKQEGQQQLAEKVRWMVNSKSATAEIRLDPPDLGGINIKVNLSGDTAQVNFNVQSAAAKEALDQAVPRLRDMLQDQGIELGESVVQQESQNSQQGETSENRDSLAHGNNMGQNDTPEIVEDNTIQVMQQRVSGGVLGGIDYYA
jgi:flagellar hook-length control protein FliK